MVRKDNDTHLWITETLTNQPFNYNLNNNNLYRSLYDGQAKLIGKNKQSYTWSTNAIGEAFLK